MIVGFTGTRVGMSAGQFTAVAEWLYERREEITAVHHGGAIGSDAEFHWITRSLEVPRHVHWSDRRAQWGKLQLEEHDVEYHPLPPLERNALIVDACDQMLAVPETLEETVRSGTWATVRYARSIQKPRLLFGRFGETQEEVDLP